MDMFSFRLTPVSNGWIIDVFESNGCHKGTVIASTLDEALDAIKQAYDSDDIDPGFDIN